MRMNRWFAALLGVGVFGCGESSTPASQPPAGGAKAQAFFKEARHAATSKIAQTLAPDGSALSILFDDLQAKTEAKDLGVAQLSESLAVPIEGTSTAARVSIKARVANSVSNGDCELSMSTPSGGTRHWSDADGSFVLDLVMDVATPFTLKLAVSGVCWSPATTGSFAMLTVESLDLTVEPRDGVPAAAKSTQ